MTSSSASNASVLGLEQEAKVEVSVLRFTPGCGNGVNVDIEQIGRERLGKRHRRLLPDLSRRSKHRAAHPPDRCVRRAAAIARRRRWCTRSKALPSGDSTNPDAVK